MGLRVVGIYSYQGLVSQVMNQSTNDKGDCRTALATPGLLKSPHEPRLFRRESISKFFFCIENGLTHELFRYVVVAVVVAVVVVAVVVVMVMV